MAILRNKLIKDYTMIPNWIIFNENVSDGAFRLLVCLYSKPDNWNVRQPNLAKELNIGISTISNRINELKKLNMIEIKRVGSGYEYHLQTDVGTQDVGTQDVGTQDVGTQDVGTQDVGIHNKTNNNKDLNSNNTDNNNTPDNYFENFELNELYQDYLKMRKEKKSKATATTIQRQIKMLNELNIDEAKKVINRSIINGWTGLFPKKQPNNMENLKEA